MRGVIKGLNFEQAVVHAVSEEQTSFTYHGNEFMLEEAGDGLVSISMNGKVIADAMIEGNGAEIEFAEGVDPAEVENMATIRPVIENGKLVNMREICAGEEGRRKMLGELVNTAGELEEQLKGKNTENLSRE